jgi:hypothetical protein
VEHGRSGGAGQRPNLGGSDAAEQGRGPACATGVALAGAERCGSGSGVVGAGAAARMEAMRERGKQEKERVSLNTIPAYVLQADKSVDEQKWAGLRGDRGAPDEHKLRTSAFKPMNII